MKQFDAQLKNSKIWKLLHTVFKRLTATTHMPRYLGIAVIGYLMSKAFVLGGLSPFAAAFVAAQSIRCKYEARGNSVPNAAFALAGTLLGYLSGGVALHIRYMAVCALIFSAGVVFRSVALTGKRVFAPLVSSVTIGATGLVYWASNGIETLPLVLLTTELLLTAGCAYLFEVANDDGISAERAQLTYAGRLLIASCCLMSLSHVEIGTLSPARVIAVCTVLLISYRGGAGMGAGTGLCVGLVMDLGLGFPYYSMAYGSAGLSAGLFKRAGKLFGALAFVCTGAVTALWAASNTQRLSVMLEYFIASVIFLLIPDTLFSKLTFSTVSKKREIKINSIISKRENKLLNNHKVEKEFVLNMDIYKVIDGSWENLSFDEKEFVLYASKIDGVHEILLVRELGIADVWIVFNDLSYDKELNVISDCKKFLDAEINRNEQKVCFLLLTSDSIAGEISFPAIRIIVEGDSIETL